MVAISPNALVWCNVGPGLDGRDRPWRSSWTWQGLPLPFIPARSDALLGEAAWAPILGLLHPGQTKANST
ncbi:hypothetical protein [Streptomyces sp. NPDC004296]|uniref:hypothetical protein n=1 Tax=Streptomyces sp. NPDC004296 TaxID=3364697 RepID=UPI003681E895